MIPITHLEVVTDRMIEGPKDGIIDTARRAAEWAAPLFSKSGREMFYVCLINNACEPLAAEMVALGGKSECGVDISCVFQQAVLLGASAIICFHNHPSGRVTPSEDDLRVTRRLKLAGDLLNVKLADHIIIGRNDYYSFREHNEWEEGAEDEETDFDSWIR